MIDDWILPNVHYRITLSISHSIINFNLLTSKINQRCAQSLTIGSDFCETVLHYSRYYRLSTTGYPEIIAQGSFPITKSLYMQHLSEKYENAPPSAIHLSDTI